MESIPAEPIFRPEVVPGKRVFLSQVLREDVPLFARWFSDLELTAYLGAMGTSFTIAQEYEWFEGLARSQDNKTFAIVVREGQRLIGSCSLSRSDSRAGVGELGIAIGDKAAWGQGYGTEAVRLLCDYGFTFLNLHMIYLWHAGFNERGHRAYLKAGFKIAGRLREARTFAGRRYDDVLMDITRDEFGDSRLTGMLGA
jgi:RimJ/RimL family protein N-acetyltransferase